LFASFKRESRKWWRISRWYKQAALWTIILTIMTFLFFALLTPISGLINLLNEFYAFLQDPSITTAITTLSGNSGVAQVQFSTASLVLPIMFLFAYTLVGEAIIVIFGGQFFGELRDGALSWALSKPITRGAYVVSKALADVLGVFVMVLLIPFLFIWVITSTTAVNQNVPLPNYFGAVLILAIGMMFWHSFVMMLTFVTNRRGVTFIIPVVLLLLGNAIARTIGETIPLVQTLSPFKAPLALSPLLTGTLTLDAALPLILPTIGWALVFYLMAYLSLRKKNV
jgi:hypothetical protein